MRRLVVVQQTKGIPSGSVSQKFQGEVGDNIRHISRINSPAFRGAVKLWEEGLSRDLERLLMPRGPSVKASLLLLLGRPAEARPLLSPAALAYGVELATRAKQQGLSAVGPLGSQAEAR